MFCPHRMQRRSHLNSIIMKLGKVDGVSCIHKIIRGTAYDLLVKINGNELGDKISHIRNFKNAKMTLSLIIVMSVNEKMKYLKLVGQKNMWGWLTHQIWCYWYTLLS